MSNMTNSVELAAIESLTRSIPASWRRRRRAFKSRLGNTWNERSWRLALCATLMKSTSPEPPAEDPQATHRRDPRMTWTQTETGAVWPQPVRCFA